MFSSLDCTVDHTVTWYFADRAQELRLKISKDLGCSPGHPGQVRVDARIAEHKAVGQIVSLRSHRRFALAHWARLRRIQECRRETFKNTSFSQISRLLTTDAQWRPRRRLQAPPANFTAAMHARSERTILNSEQR